MTISLRLPDSLHNRARELAERQDFSINQFITVALAEKLSAMLTEDYLKERANRGSRKTFERALKKVPAVEPVERDRLQAAFRRKSTASGAISTSGQRGGTWVRRSMSRNPGRFWSLHFAAGTRGR